MRDWVWVGEGTGNGVKRVVVVERDLEVDEGRE